MSILAFILNMRA